MAGVNDWTAAENAVVVAAYLRLLEAELRGERPVKADANRDVQRRTGRGKGSVEFKFRNVSAALAEMRHPWVFGYKPALNYQDSLVAEVISQIERRPAVLELAFERLTQDVDVPASAGDFTWNEIDAPQVELPRPRPGRRVGRWDFVRLDAENRSLGEAGELAVLRRERSQLSLLGLHDLAAKVEHVSQTSGDGLGFDILSFTPEAEERYIEVKTTRQGSHWPMIISRNEVRISEQESDKYEVARVFNFSADAAGIFTLRGNVRDTCQLDPTEFSAVPHPRVVAD